MYCPKRNTRYRKMWSNHLKGQNTSFWFMAQSGLSLLFLWLWKEKKYVTVSLMFRQSWLQIILGVTLENSVTLNLSDWSSDVKRKDNYSYHWPHWIKQATSDAWQREAILSTSMKPRPGGPHLLLGRGLVSPQVLPAPLRPHLIHSPCGSQSKFSKHTSGPITFCLKPLINLRVTINEATSYHNLLAPQDLVRLPSGTFLQDQFPGPL